MFKQPPPLMAKITEKELEQIREDRQYLSLKLKYVQSVNTLFRQKVSILLKDAFGGSMQVDPISAQVSSIRDMVEELEEAEKSSPMRTSLTMLPMSDRAEYWREKFMQAMVETRPTSLKEAQTLCTLLQEKTEIIERERKLIAQHESLQNEYAKMQENYMRLLKSKAVHADEALKELYKTKEAALLSISPQTATGITVEEMDALRLQLDQCELKNKALRLRVAELRKQLATEQETSTRVRTETSEQLSQLGATVRHLKGDVAVCEADFHRAQQDLLLMQRDIQLRDNTITRLECRVAALEKEADCALKEGLASYDTNELQMLRRQIDTFELHIRKLESEAVRTNDLLHEKDRQLNDMEDQLRQALLQAQVKEKVAVTYKSRIDAFNLELEQRGHHAKMLEDVESRLKDAVSYLEKETTTRTLVERLRAVESQLQKYKSVQSSLEEREEQLKQAKAECAMFRDELARAVKTGKAPEISEVEEWIVRCALAENPPPPKQGDDQPAPAKALPMCGLAREVVLREDGKWKEIREVGTGAIYYATVDVGLTPFKPRPPAKTPKATPLPPVATSQPSSKQNTPRETVKSPSAPQSPVVESEPQTSRQPAPEIPKDSTTHRESKTNSPKPANADPSSSQEAPEPDKAPALDKTDTPRKEQEFEETPEGTPNPGETPKVLSKKPSEKELKDDPSFDV